ncbi:rRNA pseudouridine synthase [Candidatus Parcubacteria bacterium]|jgi:23S rRNA pseudouridine2605 synthase|nr:rRNA pseudouridine synthase [Candidatus Parcubacteria bacterium]
MKKIRLAKFLSAAGVASRRNAEELIKQGKVKIDGQVVEDVATSVDADSPNIEVSGRPVSAEVKVYYLLNKPTGYICSVKDPYNPETVLSLVPKRPKVFPVGRLDKNSQGLLLLTNDGDLAYKITHPKFEVRKTYLVKVNKKINKTLLPALKQGVYLEEGLAQADKVEIFNDREFVMSIHQGWKRQIRRMLEELGYRVTTLTRIAEGKLKLDRLASGEYKILSKEDIL